MKIGDKNGQIAQKVLSISVQPKPTITSTTLPMGKVGVAYSAAVTASGG